VKFNVNGSGVDAEGKVIAAGQSGTEANLLLSSIAAPGTAVSGDLWNESGVLKFYNGATTKTIAFTDSSITGSAASLTTSRTISLGGDLSGSASFNGTSDITITATIAADSIALGTDTTGDYVATIGGTANQVTVAGAGTEGRGVTLSLPQDIATSSAVSFGSVTTSGDVAVNGGDITTTATTATIFNANATTLSIGNAATTLSIGATTGTTTVENSLIVDGDLTVNGTTTTVNSTTITTDDVVITLGGDTAPVADDNKDRGVEFRYHNGSAAKVGFFGYDDSTGKFTFIPDATNSSEVFSGTKGTIDVGSVEASTLFVDSIEIDTTGASSAQVLAYDGTKFAPTTLVAASVFNTFSVSGQSDVVADSATDTLTLVAGTGVTITTNATTDTITITNDGVTSLTGTANEIVVSGSSGAVTLSLPDTINANTTGSAATLTTSRTISLGGDLSGSASFNGSADITITATIAADSVALGTDTTGNFVAGITGTANQVSVSGSGSENAAVTLSLPQDIATSSAPTFAALNVSDGSTSAQTDFDSTTTTSTSTASIKSVTASSYRSMRYTIQATQGTNYMVTEILAVHNGTSVNYTEYGTIVIGTAPASFDVDIDSGSLRLLTTPATANSTTFRVHSVALAA
jgi:hypothetical protein